VPFNIQKMMDDPFGTFGADATSQFTVLSNGTLVTTYKAPDGTLLGNATQNADGTGSVSLFATSAQSWIKETGFFNTKGQLTSAESQKVNGDLERTYFGAANNEAYYARTFIEDLKGALKTQRDVFDSGNQILRDIDTRNARLWDERVTGMDPTGNVTAVQVKLDGETTTRSSANLVDFSAIGQVFGSAIGRAIAGNNNQFVTLAAGTIAGFVGQKFVQALINGPGALDLAKLDISDVFFGNQVSLAGAGLGAASSFLAAELATSIGLNGVGAQMFASAVGGYAGSVLEQVRQQGFSVLTANVNWNVALHASEVNIATTIGSLLAHQFVHPETQFGAVGGQLAGAVGSALAYSFSVGLGSVLNVFLPGVGAFFGTIIGTMLGDAIAGDPVYPMAYHDVRILGSDYHFTNRLVGTDNHGNAAVSEEMGDQVTKIANSYLDAVHGAAISYSGKVMIGYNAGAAPYQYITGWFPDGINGPSAHFASATDAIQEGVRELLVNTEVLGGDLLIKRAHQAFINGHHPAPTEIASDFTDLASLGGDLRTAQDYEQYLNDRETINALIQLYPNSAFTAGWAATFARVKELGLDHVRGSDFLGGLVGYLDSVAKAGLGAEAANAIVKRGSDNSVIVEIKVANGAEVPGALSVFADHMTVTSDASGQTLQFTVDSGLGASGTLLLGPGAGSAGHDIMVGGAGDDAIAGGAGFDFIDGGAGSDYLFGQDGSDILRGSLGNDNLQGGLGNDTYVFNRGDGVDTVLDDYTVTTTVVHDVWRDEDGDGTNELHHDSVTTTDHPNAGTDSLVFGPGISRADVVVQRSGNDLIVGVKDPAHPGALTDQITLQRWFDADGFDRIENFVFADGAPLNLAAGALGAYLVPFGESLSRNTVAENTAIGTVVGKVSTFDFNPGAVLHYSIVAAAGPFAINATTGEITVAGTLNYEQASLWQPVVRVDDQNGNGVNAAFLIHVTDVNEKPADITLSGGTAPEDSPGGTIIATATGIDPDPGTTLHYSLTDDAGGRFLIYQTGQIAIVNQALIDYETASSYHIKVKAADQYGLFVEKDFTLHVTDVYEGPFGFEPVTAPLSAFAFAAGGWSSQNLYPRLLGDVNGDGMTDIVAFGPGGVSVARATGNGQFATPTDETGTFGFNAGWVSQDLYPRLLGDVNGDGRADIVAFGPGGVSVSRATGNGHFAAPTDETGTFGFSAGWSSQDQYPRQLADVNGDGRADIVGFAAGGVVVSLAVGDGHFATPTSELANFTVGAGGWTSQNQYPRLLADVNGDGMADIVGFGADGVGVSLATGGGHFASPIGGIANMFGYLGSAGGWTSQSQYPRLLADVNGDGMADIVGFGADGVGVALATGGGHFATPLPGTRNFALTGGWDQNLYPRGVGDVNGDGRADIIGFAHDGVLEALSNGFAPSDVTLSGGSAPEDSPGGTIIATAHGIDPFPGAALTYSLTDNSGGRFLIYQSGEIAIVNRALMDYETGGSYHIKVRAADQYGSHVERDFTLHVTDANDAPVLSVPASTITANPGQSLQVSSWFAAADADHDALTYYFQDGTLAANSGVFRLNGTALAQGATFGVTAAQLATLTFVAGAEGVADDLTMQLGDGHAVSAVGTFHINVNHAPVLSVPASTLTANPGQSMQVSSWFSAADADNNALTYYFQDGTLAANSGVFVLNGTALAQGATFGVTAAQLAGLRFVSSAAGVADDLSMQLGDGLAVSAVGAFHVNVNHAPTDATLIGGSVRGHAANGTHVGTVTGADPDAGNILSYLLLDDAGGRFAIGATTGLLTVKDGTLLDDAAAHSWNIGVRTTDQGGLFYDEAFTVTATPKLIVSDFNGDGKTDLLLLNNTTGGLYICEMNGAQIGVNALSGTLTAGWHYGGLGDFNADRKSDWVLLNDATHQVYVCEMDGTAIGTNGVVANVRADLGWYYKGLGDFNNDGKSDLILFNDLTHGVYICEMDGLTMGANGLSGTIDAGWAYKTLGDFNGDDKDDFLFLNDTTHGVKVWQMDGTAKVDDQTVGTIDAAAGWRFKDTADFNGDGKTDLLLLNDANNHVMIWQMNGTSAATQVDLGAAPGGFHFADKGDFNGDGKTDLMFVNDTNGDVKVWQMNGTAIAQSATVGTMASGYHYASTGDFNGDGKTDLFFQNDATRAVQLWQMNGTEILQNSQMALLADGWHMVV
jgi:hypothetical protein